MAKARLLVELNVKPDQVEAFIAMFKTEFMSRSRSEDGCEFYELWQDPKEPNRMTIVEVWTSQAHLDTHLGQAWFADWAPKMEEMQDTPLVVRAFSSVED